MDARFDANTACPQTSLLSEFLTLLLLLLLLALGMDLYRVDIGGQYVLPEKGQTGAWQDI